MTDEIRERLCEERAAFARLETQADVRLTQALELTLARGEEQAAAAAAAREERAGLEAAAAAAARAGGRRAGDGEEVDGDDDEAQLRRVLALSLAEAEADEAESNGLDASTRAAMRLSLGQPMVAIGSLDAPQEPDEPPPTGDAAASPTAPGFADEASRAVPKVGRAGGAGLRAAGGGWKGVDAQLRQGNWNFLRLSGGHRVYSRWVMRADSADGKPEGQKYTVSSTPSDSRSYLNMCAQLRLLDEGTLQSMRDDNDVEQHGEAGADFAMIRHLHGQRKQLQAAIGQRKLQESELASLDLQLASLESSVCW